jgi:hypothetical protein
MIVQCTNETPMNPYGCHPWRGGNGGGARVRPAPPASFGNSPSMLLMQAWQKVWPHLGSNFQRNVWWSETYFMMELNNHMSY